MVFLFLKRHTGLDGGKMKGIDQKELEQKLNLVIEKLMHLGGPEDEAVKRLDFSAGISASMSGTGLRESGFTAC